MSHFYGEMRGGRQPVTRTGTKKSGYYAHIRGWNLGVKIDCYHTEEGDVIEVWKTGGSNNSGATKMLAKIREGK